MLSLMLLAYGSWGLFILFVFSSLFAFCYYVNVLLPTCTVAWICPVVLLVMSQAGLWPLVTVHAKITLLKTRQPLEGPTYQQAGNPLRCEMSHINKALKREKKMRSVRNSAWSNRFSFRSHPRLIRGTSHWLNLLYSVFLTGASENVRTDLSYNLFRFSWK